MTKNELFLKLKPVFIKLFEDNFDIDLFTKIKDIGIDSIKFITLIVRSEEIFGCEIDDDNLIMNKYKTIDDYVSMLLDQIEKGR